MATEYVTHRDLDAFKTEMHGEFAILRGEFGGIRGEIGGIRGEIGGIRSELAALRDRIDALPRTRVLVATNVAGMIGVAMLVLAAARLA